MIPNEMTHLMKARARKSVALCFKFSWHFPEVILCFREEPDFTKLDKVDNTWLNYILTVFEYIISLF